MGPVSPWNKGYKSYPFHFTNFPYRCDQLPHCKDLSDEANCQLVILPEGYVLEYPPFSTDEEGLPIKVDVMIKMDLLSISDINEVGQTFTSKFKLSISWSDFRINFHNLKPDNNMNTLTADERQSIWVPKLIFSNTKEEVSTKNDEKTFTLAKSEKFFKHSELSRFNNIYIFQGSENHLQNSRVYNVEWNCDYDMRWYPFDTQTCLMTLNSDRNSAEFVDLKIEGMEYLGPKDLTQYFIRSTYSKKTETGAIDIFVVLGRRLLGRHPIYTLDLAYIYIMFFRECYDYIFTNSASSYNIIFNKLLSSGAIQYSSLC